MKLPTPIWALPAALLLATTLATGAQASTHHHKSHARHTAPSAAASNSAGAPDVKANRDSAAPK